MHFVDSRCQPGQILYIYFFQRPSFNIAINLPAFQSAETLPEFNEFVGILTPQLSIDVSTFPLEFLFLDGMCID